MSINAFMPMGPTCCVAANATPPAGVQLLCCGNNSAGAVYCVNEDANQTVYLGFGATANDAKLNAGVPAAAGANMSVGVPPLTVTVVRTRFTSPNLYVSGITRSATQANVGVCPGEGL